MKKICLIFLSFILSTGSLWAQSEDDLYSMSLEELMNIQIESVSKKSESLFEAPLSSYIISKKEMINAGVNSIPEALKLCPGIIVREMTNGVYDLHIRGFDNPTEYSLTSSSLNLLTLVMIDNRPVFNHNNGGTFWEALPVDINDIEKIEIVRGPASALYGPNAVTGVINIITEKPDKEGTYMSGNAQYGSYNSLIANSSIGYKQSNFDITASANIQQRNRTTTAYYEFYRDQLIEDPADLYSMGSYGTSFYLPVSQDSLAYFPLESAGFPVSNSAAMYPNPEQALGKYGFNLFTNYRFSPDVTFNLSAGYNNSESERAFFNSTATVLSTISSDSRYVNAGARIYDGNFRAAYVNGYENIIHGRPGLEYSYHLFDLNFDYDVELHEKLMFRPSFNMQQATYSDEENTIEKGIPGIVNGEATFKNIAGAVRLDYRPIQKLRLIAGFRTDHFNNPDDLYYSYQFSASYKVNSNFMLRSAFSRANSGSYIGNTHSNYTLNHDISALAGFPLNLRLKFNGNPGMKIFLSRMFEIGWRANFGDFLQVDMDLFTQGGNNMLNIVRQPQEISMDPESGMMNVIITRNFENSDAHIRMNGVTLSASLARPKIMLKPFITYQHSRLTDFNRYQVHPEADPVNNVDLKTDKKHDATPDYYGGFYFNYLPVKKLNINLNSYFYGKQQQYHEQDNVMGRDSDIGAISAKFQLNGRIGYTLTEGMNVFVSGKNLFNQNFREFYGADKIGALYFTGINFRF